MSRSIDDRSESLCRWGVYLLIVTSAASMIGRIASVRAPTGETPMLSANDRSRWCTIRALAEDGTYAIDRLVAIRHPETNRRYWRSIDMVRHRGPDDREHYYSSKPPLLPTLLAGQYWLIRAVTGANLGDHPFFVMRTMLVITNVLPLLLYFFVLCGLVRRIADSEHTVLFTMAAATYGTFLTTFAVTLNNHLVAAICVLLATAMVLRISGGARNGWWFAGAGLLSAFAAANELPALSFLACAALVLAWHSLRRTLLAFLPAVALVAAGFFGTNYLAHGTWRPAYAHRSDGRVVATLPSNAQNGLDETQLTDDTRAHLQRQGITLSDQALIVEDRPGARWVLWDRVGARRFALVHAEEAIEVRQWGNWYDYPGSYWRTDRQGVDRGERSRLVYAAHTLVGHRGIFSLTPIWILSVIGCLALARGTDRGWKLFGILVLVLTIVCLAFYISRPLLDRNYGGVSCGFRWMFWLIPLWLLAMVPSANVLLRTTWGTILALFLLAVSVFSATYAAGNPWSHSWLFHLGTAAGWWQY
jgi:hypothetical protein